MASRAGQFIESNTDVPEEVADPAPASSPGVVDTSPSGVPVGEGAMSGRPRVASSSDEQRGPIPGPVKGECEGRRDACSGESCPLFGRLLKPSRDGRRRVQGCDDPVARGKRSRTKGDTKARAARKSLGLVGANTRHEELWGGPVRTESKAGGKAKPVATAYNLARAQSEAARPMGDTRPFVASFCPDGSKHTLFVIRSDDLEAAVFAMAEAWGYGAA